MKGKSIAVCSHLQYVWPALRDNLSWKSIFVLFLSDRLRQVLLYVEILGTSLANYVDPYQSDPVGEIWFGSTLVTFILTSVKFDRNFMQQTTFSYYTFALIKRV